MKLSSKLFIIIALCLLSTLSSYAINPQLIVDQSKIGMNPIPAELVKVDFNNDTLAIISVTSPLKDLDFEGNVWDKVIDNQTDGIYTYLVYLTLGSKSLKVNHENYLNATIQFGNGVGSHMYEGIKVTPTNTEVLTTDGIKADNTHFVQIQSDDFARIEVDNVPVISHFLNLDEGKHYITAQYKDVKGEFQTEVTEDNTVIDAIISGTLKLTGSGERPRVVPLDGAPNPTLIEREGNTYIFGHMLGDYYFDTQGSYKIFNNNVRKKVKIHSRNESVYRINEMTRFVFIAYHATPKEYVGFSVGGCRKFGWYGAFRCNVVYHVDSPYGEIEFVEGETQSAKNTCWTLITGPMMRLYRKLYMQLGGGFSRYLQTDVPDMLTVGFSYKTCAAAEVGLYLRHKALLIGAGFCKQFTKDAYTSGLNNQPTFTLGFAF